MTNKEIQKKNRTYFQSLANSRAALSQLRISLIAGFPIGAVMSWLLSQASIYARVLEFRPLVPVFIILTTFMGIVGFMSISKKLIYKFQIFFSFVLVIVLILLTLFIDSMSYFLSLYVKANVMYSPSSLYGKTLLMAGGVTFAISVVVNILLLRHRLKIGFSERQVAGNFRSVLNARSSTTLWITFAAVMIVPGILTQGKYLMNIFCAAFLIFFNIVFPGPIIEFSYLAYLKTKDKIYWEEPPDQAKKSKSEKVKFWKRFGTIFYLILSIVYFVKIGEYSKGELPLVLRVLGILILVSWLVLFIRWIIKKIKQERRKK
ncbi:hypothetical protein [Lactovum odontotermitis]